MSRMAWVILARTIRRQLARFLSLRRLLVSMYCAGGALAGRWLSPGKVSDHSANFGAGRDVNDIV